MQKIVYRHIGRRGTFLLFLAALDFVYAYSLLFPTEQSLTSSLYTFLSQIVSLDIWAILWGVVGLLCLTFAFRKEDGVGFAAAMFIKVLWAIISLLGWIFADVERGYLSATIWGAFAAVLGIIATWPDEVKNAS